MAQVSEKKKNSLPKRHAGTQIFCHRELKSDQTTDFWRKRSDALYHEGKRGVFLNLTCALDYIYLTPTLDIADAIFKQFYEFFCFIFLFFTLENETRGSNHNLQVIHHIVHCQVSLLSLKLIFYIVTKLSLIGSINGSLCSRYLWRGYMHKSISNLSYFLAVSIAIIDCAFYAGFISKGEKCNPFNSNW